jgi:SAM-dependent methyltransferase
MEVSSKEWYREWFNSPYYHILYKDRNEEEAQHFIDKLAALLHFKPDGTLLDIACGRGRHSLYLNQKGYDVTGIDLSPENIAYARQFENSRLHFFEHDMRQVFRKNAFDYSLNLFTSFGYFETDTENIQTVRAAAIALKEKGIFVLDFLNTPKVIRTLVPFEQKEIAGIRFDLRKGIDNDYILKHIDFTDQHTQFHFQEKVKALTLSDFMRYFTIAGLELLHVCGDYDLNPYQQEFSSRMILVAGKNSGE